MNRWLRWSSGYDARLTRERSPVQSRDEVFFCIGLSAIENLGVSISPPQQQHWSSGYDVRLTRGRSPVQSWDAVRFSYSNFIFNLGRV